MPRKFTFGVPDYFNFTFRAAHKSSASSLPDGTVHVESGSSVNTDPEISKEARILAPPPSHGTGNVGSSPCGTLNILPLEDRTMIYINLLYYKRKIKQAHTFLGRQPPITAEDCTHIEAIDAALLRTCRAIYSEAIRVLYGMNHFCFSRSQDVKEFAHFGLGNTPFGFYRTASEPSSAVSHAPYGRLTMIRFLSLRLNSVNNERDWKKIWSLWSDFFYPPEERDQSVGFPALMWLVLDFKQWELGGGGAWKLRVCPYFSHHRMIRFTATLTYLAVHRSSPSCRSYAQQAD